MLYKSAIDDARPGTLPLFNIKKSIILSVPYGITPSHYIPRN